MEKDNSKAHWIGGYELPIVKIKKNNKDIWGVDSKMQNEYYNRHDGKGCTLGIMIILIGSILFWGGVFYFLIYVHNKG